MNLEELVLLLERFQVEEVARKPLPLMYPELKFEIVDGDIWVSRGPDNVFGWFEPLDDGNWNVRVFLTAAIDCDDAIDEERREEAVGRMESEMWPAFRERGYAIDYVEDEWYSGEDFFQRCVVKQVVNSAEILAEACFLMRAYLSDRFRTERIG